MATGIAYSGGPNIKTDFPADTRALIVSGLGDALVNTAGWTLDSGGGSDRVLRSALTSQGLRCKVRIWDPGSSHARVQFRNDLGTRLAPIDHFLTASAGRELRVIANPFQFAVLVPNVLGSASNGTFVMGGVPKLEDHMVEFVKECIWSQGDLHSGGVNFGNSFRNGATVLGSSHAWYDVNSDLMPTQSRTDAAGGIGNQCLLAPFGYTAGNNPGFNDRSGHLFINGEGFKTPARICWGLTSQIDPPHVRGYVWDGVVTTGLYPNDVEDSYDSHIFYNVSWPNTYVGSAGLWLVVP